jgi:hypothetical protein
MGASTFEGTATHLAITLAFASRPLPRLVSICDVHRNAERTDVVRSKPKYDVEKQNITAVNLRRMERLGLMTYV